ncbi:hypothetical protein JW813_11420 [Clostridium botulinum]|uniref:hypothetical protein n=1 Tax=Clostridium botulinum TaxID=1491 RepID=UPI0021AFB5DB|nr:hypothetical protein [Clostridium botulinum]UZP02327.1 hypothetical protein JW813_11420 [Clostridium botulinum]UZP05686.1 hypothetical protein JYA71_11690 [Clostridium botulinum]UZP09066.1 hypothetical protein JYA74_11415 [Clostridium botulinum]
MNNDSFYDLDEILKQLGYKKCKQNNSDSNCKEKNEETECKVDPTAGASTNDCQNLNLDMPYGFQDLDPMLMLAIGELIANVISSKLPSSLLNAYGNWLQLVGQVIETFNAQQQYQECGPGRYYNPMYKNVANPFCSNENVKFEKEGKSHKRREKNNYDNIKTLTSRIDQLEKEIEELKKKSK